MNTIKEQQNLFVYYFSWCFKSLPFTRTFIAKLGMALCFIAVVGLPVISLQAQKPGKNEYILYNVSKGETFASIARLHNVKPQELADYNNLDYYEGSLVSKTLRIPVKQKEVAEPKEVKKIATPTHAQVKAAEKTIDIRENNPSANQPGTTGIVKNALNEQLADARILQEETRQLTAEKPKTSTSEEDAKVKTAQSSKSSIMPMKEMMPVAIFLTSSIILLVAAIFLYKSLSK